MQGAPAGLLVRNRMIFQIEKGYNNQWTFLLINIFKITSTRIGQKRPLTTP